MSLLHKHKSSRTRSEKYYIHCTDPNKTLTSYRMMDTSFQRTIVDAIQKEVNVHQRHVVVKVMPMAYEQKAVHEYTIGNTLQTIPGFIRFICLTGCTNAGVYEHSRNPSFCSFAKQFYESHDTVQLLVMPYFPLSSMRTFAWYGKEHILRSCLQQIVMSLFIAFQTVGFLHNDLHLDNVLLRRTQKECIKYQDKTIVTHGIQIVIMDFEYSKINVDIERDENKEQLFYDLLQLFGDLTNEKGAHLQLENIRPLQKYVTRFTMKRPSTKKLTHVAKTICTMIEHICFKHP